MSAAVSSRSLMRRSRTVGRPRRSRRRSRPHVTLERAKTIITRNDSPDISFDRSINPYRGCEHGCVYCFARPTHAYMGLSPGLDFETRLFAKADAAALLERELSAKNYQPTHDRHRHQHRSLSADRARISGDAASARGSGAHQSSGRYRDQIRARAARSRSSGADGAKRALSRSRSR